MFYRISRWSFYKIEFHFHRREKEQQFGLLERHLAKSCRHFTSKTDAKKKSFISDLIFSIFLALPVFASATSFRPFFVSSKPTRNKKNFHGRKNIFTSNFNGKRKITTEKILTG